MSDLETFLKQTGEITQHQQRGITSGRKMVSARESGLMFYGPETPAHIMNARTFVLPTVAEWETMAVAHAQKLQAAYAEVSKPEKSPSTFNPKISIERI